MRSWLVRICVFLLLGAIVNVAVAWGYNFVDIEPSSIGKSGIKQLGAGRFWRASLDRFPNRDIISSSIWTGFCTGCDYRHDPLEAVPSQWRLRLASFESEPSGFRSLKIIVLGWPKRTVWRAEDTVDPMAIAPRGNVSQYGVLWPGFAINTVFYAFVLWLLFAAPFALRRRMRIKRGLCPKCAYDLRAAPADSIACPECGAARR